MALPVGAIGGPAATAERGGVGSASDQPPVERQALERRQAPLGAERDRELGAYLVLYALLAVVFFTMAAIVLDIAALRQGRRADRTAADLAVTAGVTEIDTGDPSTFARACEAAWGYVLANKTEAGGTISPPLCNDTFPAGDACTSATPARTATATIGPLTVEITHPVPDASPLMRAETQGGDEVQAIYPPADGVSCTRLAVRIVRDRTFLFAQIAGAIGGTTDVHSVARAVTTTSTTEVPGIVALERTGCDGVTTTGGGRLDVRGVGDGGIIVVDSDGSACSGGFTVRPDPSGRIRAVNAGPATGLVSLFALAGPNFPVAYDPADVGGGRLAPQPTPALLRTSRAIIDNRYNCTGVSCAAGSDEVDQLEAADGGPGAPAGHTPYVGVGCTVAVTGIPELVVGDTYVDCPVLDVFGSVTFSAASVVTAGDVVVHAGGCLAVNSTECGAVGVPAADGVAFVRGSLVKEPAAGLFLRRAFVWAGQSLDVPLDPDPSINDGALGWTAPTGGRFQDLLLWGENPGGTFRLAEQDTTEVEGTVFVPDATVDLESRPGGASLDLPLQVVAGRVRLVGGGDVTLRPAPGRATGRLSRQVRLIR